MKKLLLLIIATLSLNSCFTMTYLATEASKDDISKTDTFLHLKIFQTLDDGFALAKTNQYDAVAIYTHNQKLYDGKQLDGRFKFIDTYSYTTAQNVYKTVPVFMPVVEYKKYGYSEKELIIY